MDSQITSKSGLANDFWLQMAALAILTIVVIGLAAKYVWWGHQDGLCGALGHRQVALGGRRCLTCVR